MATFDVSIYEPIHPGWTADSTVVTADSTVYTADGGPLQLVTEATDAGINAHIYDVDIFEPVASVWTADSSVVTADSAIYTADGGPLVGAREITDAEVISAEVPIYGGGYYRPLKPYPVVGHGYGVLPELEGEAIGVVAAIGAGASELPQIGGEAAGASGVAGHGAAQIPIHAEAVGQRGVTGALDAALAIAAAGNGAAAAYGSASGTIVQLKGAATGRHDDDEAAIITFLLAA
jgi:hypothetical protein